MGELNACMMFNDIFFSVHGNSESEDDYLEFLNQFERSDGPPLIKIMALKDKGNDLFKQNLFDPAGFCYDKACRLLCVAMKQLDNYDVKFVTGLGVSLYLNSAACANKLGEYEAAINFCSLVLSSFPDNVKALFRRAVAFMKSNMLIQAQLDLEAALVKESHNKDIHRELSVVKNLLCINSNGKRCETINSTSDSRDGKKVVSRDTIVYPVDENDVLLDAFDMSSVSSDLSTELVKDSNVSGDSDSSLIVDINREMEVDSNLDFNQDCDDQRIFHFTKKGNKHSQLRLSVDDYKKLKKGEKISFYQKTQFAMMRVRILDSTSCGQTTRLVDPILTAKRKRRRRRRRRSRRSTRNDTENEEGSSESMNKIPLEDNHGYESVVGNYIVGKDDPNKTAVPSQRSHARSIIQQPQASRNFVTIGSQHQQLDTIFYFRSKMRKTFRAKRTTVHHQCEEGEPPRRISFTISNSRVSSSKFLRPRGVSMSCCRYPSKPQVLKKRKQR